MKYEVIKEGLVYADTQREIKVGTILSYEDVHNGKQWNNVCKSEHCPSTDWDADECGVKCLIPSGCLKEVQND